MIRPLLVMLTLVGALGGCAVGPNYKRPPVPSPPTFRGAEPAAPADATSLGDLRWWEVFQDAELQRLVRAAVVNNYAVQIAVARVLEAQAQVGVARADLLPSLSAGASSAGRRSPVTRSRGYPVRCPTMRTTSSWVDASGSRSTSGDPRPAAAGGARLPADDPDSLP